MRAGILCAGCVLVDVNKRIDRWPPEQEVALIEAEDPQCGGPGLNIALDLARLEAPFPIAIIGAIGSDRYGEMIESRCDEHGIDRSRLRRTAAPTSYTDVMIVTETGRRTFFHAQGANGELALHDFDFSNSSARLFHIGSPGLHAALDALDGEGRSGFESVLKQARAAGLRTNLEMVTLPRDRLTRMVTPLLPHLSTIVINDLEAEALTGLAITRDGITSRKAAEAAAMQLLALGVGEAAAIHFPLGAVAATPSGVVYQPSVRVPPQAVVSSNGAGDAFAAGFMHAFHEQRPPQEGLALGHAAAAASLRATSTFEGVASASECLDLARHWGWRDAQA
jgi:sugar/nucleoside kinase (ribokinase family)